MTRLFYIFILFRHRISFLNVVGLDNPSGKEMLQATATRGAGGSSRPSAALCGSGAVCGMDGLDSCDSSKRDST